MVNTEGSTGPANNQRGTISGASLSFLIVALLNLISPPVHANPPADWYIGNKSKSYEEKIERLVTSNLLSLVPAPAPKNFNTTGDYAVTRGDYQEAVRQYSRTIAADPSNQMALTCRGYAFAKMKQFDYALADMTASLKYFPIHSVTRMNRSECLRLLKRAPDSLGDLTYLKQRSVTPQIVRIYETARDYATSGASSQAINMVSPLKERCGKDPYLHWLTGDAFSRLNKPKEAIACYTTAIKLSPPVALLYSARAHEHIKLGAYKEALQDLKRQETLPGEKPSLHLTSKLKLLTNDRAGALIDGNKAVRAHPKSAYMRFSLVHNLMLSGALDRALDECDSALIKFPGKEAALFLSLKGQILARKGNYQKAADVISQSIKEQAKLDNRDSELVDLPGTDRRVGYSHLLRAIYQLKSGQYERAEAALNELILAMPASPDLLRLRAQALSKQEKNAEALKEIEKALALKPKERASYLELRDRYQAAAGASRGK